jgi:hypothetical protein
MQVADPEAKRGRGRQQSHGERGHPDKHPFHESSIARGSSAADAADDKPL